MGVNFGLSCVVRKKLIDGVWEYDDDDDDDDDDDNNNNNNNNTYKVRCKQGQTLED